MPALTVQILTREEFIARTDEDDLLAVAGVGGPNSSAGRTVNVAKVDAQLGRAHDTAASSLLTRYPNLTGLQVENAPEALKGAVYDLAWYWLHDRDGGRSTTDNLIRKRFEDAQAYLDKIAKGLANLNIDQNGDGEGDGAQPGFGTVRAEFDAPRAQNVLGGYR